jgi:GTP pyrophosphokinase
MNAIKESQRRLIEVTWGDKQVGSYPVDLKLRVDNSTHILRDISGSLANEKINILSLQTQKVLQSSEVYIYLSIELTSVQQLKRALELLQKIPNVLEVQRW